MLWAPSGPAGINGPAPASALNPADLLGTRSNHRGPQRQKPTPRAKRSRTRRDRRRNATHTGPMKCAPDLEQLIQERREAIHTAATISASPLVSGSDTELLQPASDRPLTPDHLSESGLTGGPPVTPAIADELF
ncbi:hypothetical protein NDU88_004178 [Pleurodeles waltl]|uniref:Uncharacterized protein n=1 Tax=Pleurodeles waltl TaxID=8319 RepID=A0AAV7SI56_PLEWA|nr:hypothetical protein NDU88_004178 [Pleurodeles waltl]